MGQRSQIYVRYRTQTHTGLIARYYGWNFGFRMISRARHTVEWLSEYLDYKPGFADRSLAVKLTRILDTNFDMHDCVISTDIIKEWIEEFPEEDFKSYVFIDHDNNNGKLFLDIVPDDNPDLTKRQFWKIKYGFTDAFPERNTLTDAVGYLQQDVGPNWMNPNEHVSQEEIDTAKENCMYISDHAQLMTLEELEAFMDQDYDDHIATYPAHNYAADIAAQNLAHQDPSKRGSRQYAEYFHQLYANSMRPMTVRGHKMLDAIRSNDLNAFVEALTGQTVHDTLKFAHLCADDDCTFCQDQEEIETTMRFCCSILGHQEAKCTVNLRTQQVHNIRNGLDVPYLPAALDRYTLKSVQIDAFDYPVISRAERDRQWYPVSFWYSDAEGGAVV